MRKLVFAATINLALIAPAYAGNTSTTTLDTKATIEGTCASFDSPKTDLHSCREKVKVCLGGIKTRTGSFDRSLCIQSSCGRISCISWCDQSEIDRSGKYQFSHLSPPPRCQRGWRCGVRVGRVRPSCLPRQSDRGGLESTSRGAVRRRVAVYRLNPELQILWRNGRRDR